MMTMRSQTSRHSLQLLVRREILALCRGDHGVFVLDSRTLRPVWQAAKDQFSAIRTLSTRKLHRPKSERRVVLICFWRRNLSQLLNAFRDDAEFGGLDITVVNDLTGTAEHSSEAVEFVCPLRAIRKFAEADITNQELINQSIILVNGVRINLNLQQVE